MHDTINVRHLRKYNPRVKDYINVPPTEAEEIRRNIEEVSSIVRVFEDGSCEVTWTDCDINNTLRIPLVWLQQDDKKWRKLKKQFLETYGQSLECNPEEERESINPPVVIPEEIRSRSELDFASRRVHALSQKKMASGDPRFQPKPTPGEEGLDRRGECENRERIPTQACKHVMTHGTTVFRCWHLVKNLHASKKYVVSI